MAPAWTRTTHRPAAETVAAGDANEPGPGLEMVNFLFGVLAGGLIACIATISAARNPGVQTRLGLVAPAQAALAAAPVVRTEPRCPTPATRGVDPRDLSADLYFSRRRFWYVTPAP